MIVNDLKDHVLCSQCKKFGYALGPYQCKRGHLICPKCQPWTKVCVQCFVVVDVDDPIQCHSAVDFLKDKVPVPCIYKINGCMVKGVRAEIRQHIYLCPYRNQANVGGTRVAGVIADGDGGLGKIVQKTDGALDFGNGEDTGIAENVAGRNVAKLGGTEGPVTDNTDDNMEAGRKQNQIAIGKKGDSDKTGFSDESGVKTGKETLDVVPDARMDKKAINVSVEKMGGAQMFKEEPGSSVQRKSTRTRKRPQRYSPSPLRAIVVPAKKRKAETILSTCSKYRCQQSLPANEKPLKVQGTEPFLADPYECFFCDQKFWRRSAVTSHLALVHSRGIAEKIHGKIVLYHGCMFCESDYVSKNNLKKHIAHMHRDKYETGAVAEKEDFY